MTHEQRLMLASADAMLDAYGAMRKAARLLHMAGDADMQADARKVADAIDVFMQVAAERARP